MHSIRSGSGSAGALLSGLLIALATAAACSGKVADNPTGKFDVDGSGGSGTDAVVPATGSGGTLVLVDASVPAAGTGSTAVDAEGDATFDGCTGSVYEQELIGGSLDIYFLFDRTASMGTDCAYQPGGAPTVESKACYATYAFPDYLTSVSPLVDTRLAFQFMSLANDDCDGGPYETPLVDLTSLPVPPDDAIIQAISDEQFEGGFGTHIEGALRGMTTYTAGHVTPGREMIGVLMTDGDPNGCEEDIDALSRIIADHLADAGIRTFIIGMEGATDANLEQLAIAGGAEAHDDWCGDLDAPCHFWNVGNGSGDAIASALSAIITQASPLPCEMIVADLQPPAGMTVDYGKVNVTLTDNGVTTTIGQVPTAADCPAGVHAWHYDDPAAPTRIELCSATCDLVSAASEGSQVNVVLGCDDTVTIEIR